MEKPGAFPGLFSTLPTDSTAALRDYGQNVQCILQKIQQSTIKRPLQGQRLGWKRLEGREEGRGRERGAEAAGSAFLIWTLTQASGMPGKEGGQPPEPGWDPVGTGRCRDSTGRGMVGLQLLHIQTYPWTIGRNRCHPVHKPRPCTCKHTTHLQGDSLSSPPAQTIPFQRQE